MRARRMSDGTAIALAQTLHISNIALATPAAGQILSTSHASPRAAYRSTHYCTPLRSTSTIFTPAAVALRPARTCATSRSRRIGVRDFSSPSISATYSSLDCTCTLHVHLDFHTFPGGLSALLLPHPTPHLYRTFPTLETCLAHDSSQFEALELACAASLIHQCVRIEASAGAAG